MAATMPHFSVHHEVQVAVRSGLLAQQAVDPPAAVKPVMHF
jgi:hypothetical protein